MSWDFFTSGTRDRERMTITLIYPCELSDHFNKTSTVEAAYERQTIQSVIPPSRFLQTHPRKFSQKRPSKRKYSVFNVSKFAASFATAKNEWQKSVSVCFRTFSTRAEQEGPEKRDDFDLSLILTRGSVEERARKMKRARAAY